MGVRFHSFFERTSTFVFSLKCSYLIKTWKPAFYYKLHFTFWNTEEWNISLLLIFLGELKRSIEKTSIANVSVGGLETNTCWERCFGVNTNWVKAKLNHFAFILLSLLKIIKRRWREKEIKRIRKRKTGTSWC